MTRWQQTETRDRPRDRLRLRGQVRLPQRRRGRGLLLQVGPRALARARRGDLRAQERAGLDAEVPPQVARLLPRAPAADLGRRRLGDRLRQHLLLHQADREAGRLLGGPAGRHQGHLGQARASPRRRRSTSPASAPSTSPRSSTTSSRRTSTKQGVIFLDMDSGLREHEELVKQYFGTIIPHERQQVRGAEQRRLVGRLVHLRAEGRQDRAAAPGLLPDQRREHGPVRAHADHRRRGRLRALRRGLHRADLLERLAALARSSRSSSRRAAAAATRRSRTGRTTSTTSSPSAPSPTRTRRWSGSTGTSARS